eukprot:15479249-Alexandrium_andersonii.AAC.1
MKTKKEQDKQRKPGAHRAVPRIRGDSVAGATPGATAPQNRQPDEVSRRPRGNSTQKPVHASRKVALSISAPPASSVLLSGGGGCLRRGRLRALFMRCRRYLGVGIPGGQKPSGRGAQDAAIDLRCSPWVWAESAP